MTAFILALRLFSTQSSSMVVCFRRPGGVDQGGFDAVNNDQAVDRHIAPFFHRLTGHLPPDAQGQGVEFNVFAQFDSFLLPKGCERDHHHHKKQHLSFYILSLIRPILNEAEKNRQGVKY